MNEVLVSFSGLCLGQNGTAWLRGLNGSISRGETIVLLGNTGSGREFLWNYLSGRESPDRLSGTIQLPDGKTLPVYQKEKIAVIIAERENTGDQLTDRRTAVSLAEGLFLMQPNLPVLWDQRRMEKEAGRFLEIAELERDASEPVQALTPFERMQLGLAGAVSRQADLVCVRGDFEGYSHEEIRHLARICRRLGTSFGMAFIFSTNNLRGASYLADRYWIFRGGRLVKKTAPAAELSSEDLEHYIAEGTDGPRERKTAESVPVSRGEAVYRADHLPWGDGNFSLQIRAGEAVSLVEYRLQEKNLLFRALAGEGTSFVYWHDELLPAAWRRHPERYRLCALDRIGREGIVDSLSIGENLLLPSLEKVRRRGPLVPRGLEETAVREWNRDLSPGQPARELSDTQALELQLESWRIFHPEVMILLEPFLHMDVNGRRILLDYMKSMRAEGTAVVIVSSSQSDYRKQSEERLRRGRADWYDRLYCRKGDGIVEL